MGRNNTNLPRDAMLLEMLQQLHHHFKVAAQGSDVNRALTRCIWHGGVSPSSQERAHRGCMTVEAGCEQRTPTLLVPRVYEGSQLQQELAVPHLSCSRGRGTICIRQDSSTSF